MADKDFPTDLSSRGVVKLTDKLIIHNIDTGLTNYTTVGDLFTAITGYEPANANIQAHIADNSQAHSDYLRNDGDDTSTGDISATDFILI